MSIRLAFKVLFYFVGTCLHELAHYGAAILLGKAEGFSVIPRIEGRRFVLGSVRSRVRYKVLSSLIAAAPLCWWVVLLLILLSLHVVQIRNGVPVIPQELIMKRLKSFSLRDAFFLWIFVQVLWAGHLSVQDLKNVLRGLFSVSGLVSLFVATGLFFFFRYVVLHS
jgi:hypothetical protein